MTDDQRDMAENRSQRKSGMARRKIRRDKLSRRELILISSRNTARDKDLEFSITIEDIEIPDFCPLLGIILDEDLGRDYIPSIDRKDNSKGYTPDNIWIISMKANRIKSNLSIEELLLYSKNIIKFFGE